MNETETLLTPAEAGRLVGVCASTLIDWVEAGRITAKRTAGGHRRYLLSEIQALVIKAAKQPKKGKR